MKDLTPEAERFIDRALTVRVVTTSARGAPLITPLWFLRDGPVIWIGSRRESAHVRQMASHPEVILLIADRGGRRTKRVLRLTGAASVGGRERLSGRRKSKHLHPALDYGARDSVGRASFC